MTTTTDAATRVAIYARVSTDHQGESVPHQVALLKEVARARGLGDCPPELVYEDEGISAFKYSIWTRPAMKRLLSDARQGKFRVVMFKGISRFARSTQEALDVLDRLKAQGLQVISYEENYDSFKENSNFIFTMHAAIAEYEAEKIGIRVRLGNKAKAQNGGWCGCAPDGYKLADGRLIVDEVRRSVINKIYNLYLEGLGSFKIAEALNDQGIRSSTGRLWSGKTIRDILKNPVYLGRLVYNRTRQSRVRDYDHPEEGKKKWVRKHNPAEEWVVADLTHEPIIDGKVFAKVEELMQRKRFKKEAPRVYHPLTGLLTCGECGQGMVCQKRSTQNKRYRYYICKTYHKYGRKHCQQANINAPEIERLVCQHLAGKLRDGFHLLKMQTEFAYSSFDYQDLTKRREKIKGQLDRLNRKTEVLFLESSKMTEDQYQFVSERLKSESQKLTVEYRTVQAELDTEVDLQAVRKEAAGYISEYLAVNPPDELELRSLLHRFIDKVVINGSQVDIYYRFHNPG